MSDTAQGAFGNTNDTNVHDRAVEQERSVRDVPHKNYKGFVAGVFSGISKLSGMIVGLAHKRGTITDRGGQSDIPSTQSRCACKPVKRLDLKVLSIVFFRRYEMKAWRDCTKVPHHLW